MEKIPENSEKYKKEITALIVRRKVMLQKSLVSVIMTNYNTQEKYLREAIESVLGQTYSDFEFIIVDDGSTDDSVSIIESYDDKRIRLIRNAQNIGLTKSLNIAMKECKGEFIARMDSDDVCMPQRFEKQVEFLRKNQDVIVCGTGARHVGDWQKHNSNEKVYRYIPKKEEHRIYLLFGNFPNIIHSTAMFNHEKLKKYGITYNENYVCAQDFRMWVSCSEYENCANIEDYLLEITVREGTISTAKKEIQEQCAINIVQEQLDKLHLKLTDATRPIHMHLMVRKGIRYDIAIKKWLKQIIEANKKYKVYDQKILEKVLWNKWAEICYYGLAQRKGILNKIKVALSLNVKYYPKLFKIRKERKNRK